MRFQKTGEGWKPSDEATWYHRSIEWNLGCVGRLAGVLAVIGGLVAGVLLHANPLTLAAAFLFRYWGAVLFWVDVVLVGGVTLDYVLWRGKQASFQEALIDTLNTINARLEGIETALAARDSEGVIPS